MTMHTNGPEPGARLRLLKDENAWLHARIKELEAELPKLKEATDQRTTALLDLQAEVKGELTKAVDRAEQAEAERDAIRAKTREFADAVEKLAFEMPPPNAFTPRFVQMAQVIRALKPPEAEV